MVLCLELYLIINNLALNPNLYPNNSYRQSHSLEVSNVKFPNMEFHGRPELARVLQKLFWSCQPTVNRFGFKRLRLESAFPELCLFFDKYFYNNSEISNLFFKGSPSIRLELEITILFLR